MIIDPIKNGIVIDHISAGEGMKLYELLGLDQLDCTIAILKNVSSVKLGKKDMIKIDDTIDMDFDVIGYAAPGVTVNIIKNGELADKRAIAMPETLTNVIHCKNPRCITSVEQELDHVFKLADREKRVYRCLYCEAAAK